MPFKPGEKRPANAGRRKGTPNKETRQLKEMILEALDKKGGPEYLQLQAEQNPTAFLTLLGKVLPMTVVGDKDNPLQHEVKINVIGVNPK